MGSIRGFEPAARAPAMCRLAFGEFKIRSSGQPLDDFALFIVEFSPGLQPSFLTAGTGGIK